MYGLKAQFLLLVFNLKAPTLFLYLLLTKVFECYLRLINPFGTRDGGASDCQNIIFINGCLCPMDGYLYEINNGSSSFPDHDSSTSLSETGISQIEWDNTLSLIVEIVKPIYVLKASGTQTVYMFYTTNGSGYADSSTSEFVEQSSIIKRESTGYLISMFPQSKTFSPGRWWGYQSSQIINIVNKIKLDDDAMYVDPNPNHTDPSFPSYNIDRVSTTNGKPVNLSIVGGQQDFGLPTRWGNGVFPDENPHINIDLFVGIRETYTRTDSMRFKFAILDDEGSVVSTSKSSEEFYMNTGDGVLVHIPNIKKNNIDVPLSNIRVYRSLNRSLFVQIETPLEEYN